MYGGGGGDGNSFGRGEYAVQLGFRRGEEHNERNVLPFDPARRIAARLHPCSYIRIETKFSLSDNG